MLLDISMPEMDGYEVCRHLKAQPATRDVPVIFVSAVSESNEKVHGFELGAVDFVTKPYQRDELLARVHMHLELNRLRNNLEDLVEERSVELSENEKKLRASLIDSIAALAAVQIAVAIAREMQLPEEQVEGIQLAGVVHDIGKIRVPAEILSKPGRLTALEFASSMKYLNPSIFSGRSRKSCSSTMSGWMVPVTRRRYRAVKSSSRSGLLRWPM